MDHYRAGVRSLITRELKQNVIEMKSSIKIGRDNTNDVIINEPRVSRNHAIITNLFNGGYEVKDLGSSNGTFVNGQQITSQIIYPGDELRVASSLVNWQNAFESPSSGKIDSLIQEAPYAKIKKTITVGSSPGNDLVISNDFVSMFHAKISVLKTGNYYLQDMGSSNGSFVNGSKIISKNFSKTDIIKLAGADLPDSWFRNKKLQTGFIKDHKKAVWISFAALLVMAGATVFYFNRCKWLGLHCSLTANQVYNLNKNTLVHIDHAYYYTIQLNGVKYFVGRNKDLPEFINANPDRQNILAYNKVTGNGCFINPDGSILTSPSITNPWLNDTEQHQMLQEVLDSKTIAGLTIKSPVIICGETATLKWIQNGVINNQQNYTEATTINECALTDSNTAIIQSVKKTLPAHAQAVKYSFDSKSKTHLRHTAEKYFGSFALPGNNMMTKDTFYMARDTADINRFSTMPLAVSLPVMEEGSAVFNARGELIGLVKQQHVSLLPFFLKQINKH
jgi:pSer/pThr/pTyr-binding forkhead associated (FHA) protein